MKKMLLPVCMALFCFASLTVTSCKDKEEEETATETTTTETTMPEATTSAPVEVSNDDQLRNDVTTAIKDFPGVEATVMNGEVTLTGSIKRDRLPQLMSNVNATNPMKVNNNLTVTD